jgi:hypothetical protein
MVVVSPCVVVYWRSCGWSKSARFFDRLRLADRRTGEIESVYGSGWVVVADSNAVGERGARRFGWWWSRLVSLCIGGAVDGQSLLNFLIGCGSRTGALGR